MKKLIWTFAVGLGACLVHADLVIDNFSSGSYVVSLTGAGLIDLEEQDGSMIGGHRDTQFQTVLDPYDQTASMQIDPELNTGSHLAGAYVSGGVGVTDMTTFEYGWILNGSGTGLLPDFLHEDFTTFAGLDFNFITNDQSLGYSVLITSDNGTISSLGNGTIAANASSFTYGVAFNTLSTNPDLSDIDQIYISFNASAGGDYALSSLTASGTPEPASFGALALGILVVARRRRTR